MRAASEFVDRRSWRQASLWREKPPLLPRLDIELTERCNNNCVHCCINLAADDQAARARELTTQEWQGILTQATELGVLSVRFTGGEPLLRPDFEDLYLFARRLGLRVLIYTNARLITPRLADLWARIPPLEKIEVTAYGMNPDSYDGIARVRGSFDEYRRGLDLLLDRRIPFLLKGTLLPATLPEKGALEAWAAEILGMETGVSYAVFLDLRLRRDSENRNRHIRSLRLQPELAVTVLARGSVTYLKEIRRLAAVIGAPRGDWLFNCGAGQLVSVDAYGVLQPCMGVRAPEFTCNLMSGSMKEAITEIFPAMLKLRATNRDYLARCARCLLGGWCEQCPAKSWAEHGTLDTPLDYVCEVTHAAARAVGLLSPGERGWEVSDGQRRINKLKEKIGRDERDGVG